MDSSSTELFMRWHLIVLFLIALIVGYLLPEVARVVNQLDVGGIEIKEGLSVFSTTSDLFISFIFLISGLTLSTDELSMSLFNFKTTLFPLMSILLLSPMLALWTRQWNFKIDGYTFGLSLGLIQATTLSSGPVIVSQARGNVYFALWLTISTNFLAIFTMPIFLTFIADTSSETLEPGNIIIQLLIVILLPLFIGKMINIRRKPESKLTKNILKFCSSLMLTLIIWGVVGKSANEFNGVRILPTISLISAVCALHVFLLSFNYIISKVILKLDRPEVISITICCSQKTLPIAVAVLDQMDVDGLPIVPLIAIQVIQVIFDAILAAYWSKSEPSMSNVEEVPIHNETNSQEKNQDNTNHTQYQLEKS